MLISDVKQWGGWVRANYIRKYLKDTYDFHLLDADEFNEWERVSVELPKYDLYYFLFHTMLMKKSVQRFLKTNSKVVTIVTVFPTLRNIFYNRDRFDKEYAKNNFLKLANQCAGIFANNYKSLTDLRNIYTPNKTYYMTRGVDSDIFFPNPNEEFLRKEDHEFTVAFCGKPNPEKGLREIIRPACEEANVRLITNERNFTNALSENEMRDFYNKADIYIVASTMDGTPNTALEAASCGKAILSNDIGNMPEFIEDGVNGFLVPLEVKKYVQKLRWMRINQKRTWEMGREARETVLRKWTWEKVINRNERKVFGRILNG